jgi:hypothetical protein
MSAYIDTRVAYGLQVLKAPLEVLLVGEDAQAGRAILLVGLRDLHLPRTCRILRIHAASCIFRSRKEYVRTYDPVQYIDIYKEY